MEFYRPDLEAKYADIIARIDLKTLHERHYVWSEAARQLAEVAPDLAREQINELVPVLSGLAFTRHGHPGGIHACITG